MLPSSHRVRTSEFKNIFKKGRFFAGRILNLTVIEDKSFSKNSKFSFSVSKKVAKGAVLRNKLRHRGYSAIKEFLEGIQPGFLCVFVFKKGSGDESYLGIRDQIKELLVKSKLLNS